MCGVRACSHLFGYKFSVVDEMFFEIASKISLLEDEGKDFLQEGFFHDFDKTVDEAIISDGLNRAFEKKLCSTEGDFATDVMEAACWV